MTALAGAAALCLPLLSACGSSADDKPEASAASAASDMAASCGGTEADWNTLITAAQKEGKVTIAGPPNPTVNKALPDAFKSAFGIDVTYLAGSTGETAQKIKSERSAGLYSLDVFLAGGNSMSNVIYKSGWLQHLKDELVSPTITDASVWQGHGDHPPFIDEPDFNSVAKISADLQLQFIVNTDLVKGQIKGWNDLLDPKWKGKIVAMDPTTGAGLSFNVAVMLKNKFGMDFLTKLYKGQNVVMQTDDRQAADAVAKGQYAVAIGVSEANGQIDQMIDDGLPVEAMTHPNDAPEMVSAGYGEVGLLNKAPHASAAKLFVNWLLCPTGNKVWNQANRYVSLRKDVKIDVPKFLQPDLSTAYWDTYDWKLLTSNATTQFADELSAALK